MDEFIDVVAWVCLQDGRLLGARSAGKDLFYIPGGKRHPGESDIDTLVREVKEELSVDIVVTTARHLATYHAQAHGYPDGVMVRMACYTAEYTGDLVAGNEIAEFAWLRFADRDRTAEADRRLLDDLLAAGRLS
jgi:8-oxo-dGTP diphosphatase